MARNPLAHHRPMGRILERTALMAEEWRPVVGYEKDYEVSDHGRIRSLDRLDNLGRQRRGRVLSLCANSTDHLQVSLFRNGESVRFLIHRLVLEAFLGPCPEGMEACHWDDNPRNNRLSNLRWDTRAENMRDQVRNGRNHNASKSVCPRGHSLTGSNLYVKPNGRRRCRECARTQDREKKAAIRSSEEGKRAHNEYMRSYRERKRAA